MMRLIKTETSRYANTTISLLRRRNKISKRSMWQDWISVKLNEMYGFFALIIHMCMVRKPKLSDYCSQTSIIATPFPASIMPRDRFKSILSMLH